MEDFFKLIESFGLKTVTFALVICMATAIIKMPIKIMAKKLDDYTLVTRFIVFIPIVIGFLLIFTYHYFVMNDFVFNKGFVIEWTTSTTMSLSMYAIYEKIFQSTKISIKSEDEITKKILNEIETFFVNYLDTDNAKKEKIVLKGKNKGV